MKNKSVSIKKPNRVVYWFGAKIVRFFLKSKYKLTCVGLDIAKLEPPFLIIANHICNIDFLINSAAIYPVKVHIVAAALYFKSAVLRWLLKMMGCVSKEQFVVDVKSVRSIIKLLKQKENVLLYPAGQSSFTGEATYIDKSVAKLVQKLGVCVVALKSSGGHMALPKWNMKKLRPSRLEINIEILYEKGEALNHSKEDIYNKIVSSLYFDDYEWQKKAMIRAKKPRNAKGLEVMLFCCPNCKMEYTIKSVNNKLYCENCLLEVSMDEYGLLSCEKDKSFPFNTPTAWNRWQFDYYEKMIDTDFIMDESAKLLIMKRGGGYKYIGEGNVRLDINNLKYEGTINGEKGEIVIDNGLSAVFPHERIISFDVPYMGEIYSIEPNNNRSVFKYLMIKEIIFKKYFER